MSLLNSRPWGRTAGGLLGAALVAGSVLAVPGVALAAPVSVTDASFTWALSNTASLGAPLGGCHFLSAGVAGVASHGGPWAEADGLYSGQSGNVTIEKPTGPGYAAPTFAQKCQLADGTEAAINAVIGSRVVFSNGTGTVDPDANTATITWSGSFTSAFYGGSAVWWATDPTLTIYSDGTGELTATVGGSAYTGTSTPPSGALTPTVLTLANLTGVTVTSTGFTVTPNYLDVAITVSPGTPQSAKVSTNEATWGAWPQAFAQFQQLTGQASFWYSTGTSAQPNKLTLPLTVAWTVPSSTPSTTPSPTGTDDGGLANTGPNATLFLAVGAGLVVLGIVLILVLRRRRSSDAAA